MDALGKHSFAVAPTWQATAHHVLAANGSFPYRCFFESYRYATDAPFNGPGCGTMLVAGGHPRATACLDEAVSMSRCADQVPFAEAFDLVVQQQPPAPDYLPIASTAPSVGDKVYVVGWPSFAWLSETEREALGSPLVSSGEVLAVQGRGAVISAAASDGSSGGPLLNERGEALGVLYTRIDDQRAQGTPTPTWARDSDAVVVLFDAETRRLVSAAQ